MSRPCGSAWAGAAATRRARARAAESAEAVVVFMMVMLLRGSLASFLGCAALEGLAIAAHDAVLRDRAALFQVVEAGVLEQGERHRRRERTIARVSRAQPLQLDAEVVGH